MNIFSDLVIIFMFTKVPLLDFLSSMVNIKSNKMFSTLTSTVACLSK